MVACHWMTTGNSLATLQDFQPSRLVPLLARMRGQMFHMISTWVGNPGQQPYRDSWMCPWLHCSAGCHAHWLWPSFSFSLSFAMFLISLIESFLLRKRYPMIKD